jgi:hypothetical protein
MPGTTQTDSGLLASPQQRPPRPLMRPSVSPRQSFQGPLKKSDQKHQSLAARVHPYLPVKTSVLNILTSETAFWRTGHGGNTLEGDEDVTHRCQHVSHALAYRSITRYDPVNIVQVLSNRSYPSMFSRIMMATYDVTRPGGICLTASYTLAWNSSPSIW